MESELLRIQLSASSRGENVAFKYDGTRFSSTVATLKLISGSCYEIVLVSKHKDFSKMGQAQLIIQSDQMQIPEELELQHLTCEKLHKSIIKFSWTCNLPASKRSSRTPICLLFQNEHMGEIRLPIIAKIYDRGDKSVKHGMDLKHIDYRFEILDPSKCQALRSDEQQDGLVFKEALFVPI